MFVFVTNISWRRGTWRGMSLVHAQAHVHSDWPADFHWPVFTRLQVIVPLPSWDLETQQPLSQDPEKYATETELIFKYSPFKNEEQLFRQFKKIEGPSG